MADRFGYGEIGLDIHPCRGCEDYDAPDGCKSNGGCGMTQTNADRIRAMTDEELARFMSKVETNGRVFGLKGIASWLKWLRQEADG